MGAKARRREDSKEKGGAKRRGKRRGEAQRGSAEWAFPAPEGHIRTLGRSPSHGCVLWNCNWPARVGRAPEVPHPVPFTVRLREIR